MRVPRMQLNTPPTFQEVEQKICNKDYAGAIDSAFAITEPSIREKAIKAIQGEFIHIVPIVPEQAVRVLKLFPSGHERTNNEIYACHKLKQSKRDDLIVTIKNYNHDDLVVQIATTLLNMKKN